MSILDRRSGKERREMERYSVNIDVEWEGSVGRKKGTVSDISLLGCFVLSSGEVDDAETVKIFLPLTDGMKVQFLGEVINHVFEIGFAVRFVDISGAQQDYLEKLIESLAP
jgi:hypothetical protein